MRVSEVITRIKFLRSQADKIYKYEEMERLERIMAEISRLMMFEVVGDAYWIPLKNKIRDFECSNCHVLTNNKTKFCPCCGFKMLRRIGNEN